MEPRIEMQGLPLHPAAPPPPGHALARPSEAYAAHLAAIVESSTDAIIATDLNSVVTAWNTGAGLVFGYPASEMIGEPITRIFPEDRHAEEALILSKISIGEHLKHFETLRRAKDGRLVEVSITASPIRDASNKIIGVSRIARDITVMKMREREIARLSRLYAALSQVNQAIVFATSREELLDKICEVLVEFGGFKMAWIGWHDPETQRILPVAQRGDENGYLQRVSIYADDRPEGRGPTGTAFRTGVPFICNDIANDPCTLPWRGELLRRGYSSSAVFPIRVNDAACATLNVYATERDFFQDKEFALLKEAARDISFGLDSLAREEIRKQAEQKLRHEQLFSETMIASMPGVVYFYDASGRFLRWNRSFEEISGYSTDEIAAMHPLDFFAGEEKAAVEERIGEVFEKGVSSVEAAFLAKDGKKSPFYFTGRSVDFAGNHCLVGVGIDISERKQAEALLRESEQKLRALFEQAPMGIAILDTGSGRFLRLNPQYCAITGYSESEMLALTYRDITHPDDVQEDVDNMARILESGASAFQMEKRYIRKDRAVVWVRLTCVRLGIEPGVAPQHIAMVEDITKRKEADDRIAESERKYRDLVELANSIILRWDATGRITFLNEFGQKFFGYTAEEIIGRHVVGSIVPETESSGRDLQLLMEQICANPHAFETNVNENLRRDGERVLISWTNRILKDDSGQIIEILSVGTDITEHQRAEDARRTSEARYRTLFEYAPDGILIADDKSYYLDANASMCRMLGYSHDDIVGLHASDIVVQAEIPQIDQAIQTIQSRMDHHREWYFRRRDGSTFPAEVIATKMPDGNLLGMIRDVTERKQAEAALHELNETLELKVVARTEELQAAVVRAEAADRIKSAFLATMSHELRTPLNSIIGFTGILLQNLAGPLNEEQRKQLEMVRGSARHLLTLINDVLDISKIEAGQLEVASEPFDISRSLQKVCETVAPLAVKKGISLRQEFSATIGQAVGDERRFEQVLLNLLSNAIKFTEQGEVTLRAEPVPSYQPAGTGPPGGGHAICVRVIDTGIGISEDDLKTLFQPFRQLDSGLARNYEGTGLGLAICRRLVGLMGGEIFAQSTWGRGSTFSVILPLNARDEK